MWFVLYLGTAAEQWHLWSAHHKEQEDLANDSAKRLLANYNIAAKAVVVYADKMLELVKQDPLFAEKPLAVASNAVAK